MSIPRNLSALLAGILPLSLSVRATEAELVPAPLGISMTAVGPSTNTLVASGSDWKYLDNGSDQGTAWFGLSFNDSAWNSANAQFGYGDGDEITPLNFGPNPNNKYVTYYFRKLFVLDEPPSRVQSLALNLLRDDGAVVYLNGQEVHRASMPGGPINYRTYATDASEYQWQETTLP